MDFANGLRFPRKLAGIQHVPDYQKKTGRPKIGESAYIPTINEPKTQPPLAPLVTALDG